MWDPTKKDNLCPRAMEKPRKHGKRGKITFRNKPHTHQRHFESSNKPCAHKDPETPQFSSVQSTVVSDSFQPHGLQHTMPPCPSPTPRIYPNSCPLNQLCHPTISSSVIPFSYCLQSSSASGSFQMVSSSHQMAKVLEFQLQHQSFQ